MIPSKSLLVNLFILNKHPLPRHTTPNHTNQSHATPDISDKRRRSFDHTDSSLFVKQHGPRFSIFFKIILARNLCIDVPYEEVPPGFLQKRHHFGLFDSRKYFIRVKANLLRNQFR